MSAPTVLDGEDAIRAAVGTRLGTSEWYDITDERLEHFRDATGDPACTYFAVSLSNKFLPEIVEVRGYALGVNYGTQKVEVGPTLQAGDRVRATADLVDVTDVKAGVQTTMVITIEREATGDAGPASPVCVIESLSRWMNP